MKKFILFFAIAGAALISCSKDDDGNSNSGPYLQSATIAYTNVEPSNLIFEYNDQKKLKSVTGANNIVFYISYEGDKIATVTGNGTTSEFTYNGNVLSGISSNGTMVNVQYNSSQRKYTIEGSNLEYTLDEYGDITIIHTTGANGDTNVFTYDDAKKGAFYNYSPINNFIISAFIGTVPVLSAKPTLTYNDEVMANTYDDGGRLIKTIATSNGEVVYTATFTYANL